MDVLVDVDGRRPGRATVGRARNAPDVDVGEERAVDRRRQGTHVGHPAPHRVPIVAAGDGVEPGERVEAAVGESEQTPVRGAGEHGAGRVHLQRGDPRRGRDLGPAGVTVAVHHGGPVGDGPPAGAGPRRARQRAHAASFELGVHSAVGVEAASTVLRAHQDLHADLREPDGTLSPMTSDMKPRSHEVTDGMERAPARAMLRAVGMTDADWGKAQVGVASSWNEVTPVQPARSTGWPSGARRACARPGGFPIEFVTIAISDGISMGHEGMRGSLVSREIIADSVECVMHSERLDAMVTFAGCDKSLPGMLMAAARLNLPSVFLYGGSILPGHYKDQALDIVSVFEAVGACAAGTLTENELGEIERRACPTEGSCAGMFTANTMASVGRGARHVAARELVAARGRPAPRRLRVRERPARSSNLLDAEHPARARS